VIFSYLIAHNLLRRNENFLKAVYRVNKVELVTHNVIVSSLGVIPKTTIQAMKKMFKINDRVEIQTINLIAKRMSLATLKRSHDIYTNSCRRNNQISNIYNRKISPNDDPEDILEKQLAAVQNEMSATDYAVVGNLNQNVDTMTNINYDELYNPPEYDTTYVIDKSINGNSLLKDEDGVDLPQDELDPDQVPHNVVRLDEFQSSFHSDVDMMYEDGVQSLSNRIIQSREFPKSPITTPQLAGAPLILKT
jgi:hypothetical protein